MSRRIGHWIPHGSRAMIATARNDSRTVLAALGADGDGVPLMRIELELIVAGRAPFKASTTRLPHVADAMVGTETGVFWHPRYPAEVVLEE